MRHRIALATLLALTLLIGLAVPDPVFAYHHRDIDEFRPEMVFPPRARNRFPVPPDHSVMTMADLDSYKDCQATVGAGKVITYTIVAVNNGDAKDAVALFDVLPGEVAFVPGSCTYDDGYYGNWPCLNPPGHLWTENLASHERITTTFAVETKGITISTEIANQAYLNWGGYQEEMACATTVTVPPSPDLSNSYNVGPETATAGETITYTVVAANTGTAAAQQVVLSDVLPSNVTLVPGSCTYDDGGGSRWMCWSPPGHLWTENLASGDHVTTTFAVKVGLDATLGELVINRAYLSWNDG